MPTPKPIVEMVACVPSELMFDCCELGQTLLAHAPSSDDLVPRARMPKPLPTTMPAPPTASRTMGSVLEPPEPPEEDGGVAGGVEAGGGAVAGVGTGAGAAPATGVSVR